MYNMHWILLIVHWVVKASSRKLSTIKFRYIVTKISRNLAPPFEMNPRPITSHVQPQYSTHNHRLVLLIIPALCTYPCLHKITDYVKLTPNSLPWWLRECVELSISNPTSVKSSCKTVLILTQTNVISTQIENLWQFFSSDNIETLQIDLQYT